MVRPRLQTGTVIALVVTLLLIGLYALAVSAARQYYVVASPSASTFSQSDSGLSVLFRYLDEVGARPVALQRFDELPDPASSTIVVAAESDFENEPSAADRRVLAAWVRRGGRLVLAGESAQAVAESLRVSAGGEGGGSGSPLQPILPTVEAAGPLNVGSLRLLASDSSWVAHYKDISGQALISRAEGRGEVWWLASPYALSNDGLGEAANGEIALRLVTGGRRPYFDEYHHGYVRGGGIWERLRPRGRAALVLIAVALAIALVARARRLGPAIPPIERAEARTTNYIDQLADLYRKAGARAEALASLEDGLARALARRYGTVAAGMSHRRQAAEASAAAVRLRERGSITKDEFVAAAEALRRAREEVEG